jgi:hypothetical protein
MVTIVLLTRQTGETRVEGVDVELDFDQLAELELISLHAGKPPAQLLMEAALLVLTRDAHLCDLYHSSDTPLLLHDDEIALRLTRLLRR